jgi:hypothetical protein
MRVQCEFDDISLPCTRCKIRGEDCGEKVQSVWIPASSSVKPPSASHAGSPGTPPAPLQLHFNYNNIYAGIPSANLSIRRWEDLSIQPLDPGTLRLASSDCVSIIHESTSDQSPQPIIESPLHNVPSASTGPKDKSVTDVPEGRSANEAVWWENNSTSWETLESNLAGINEEGNKLGAGASGTVYKV